MAGYHSTARQLRSRLARIAAAADPSVHAHTLAAIRAHNPQVFSRAMGNLPPAPRAVISDLLDSGPPPATSA